MSSLARDDGDATPAAIVNESLARRLWQTPDDAIGKRLKSLQRRVALDRRRCAAIWRPSRLSEEPGPFVYLPLLQNLPAGLDYSCTLEGWGDAAAALRGRVRDHVQQLNPSIPIVRSMMLSEQTRVALSAYSSPPVRLTMFGVMTIVLASIGIYGLVAYTVQQSTQEIGIRMAVGARRSECGLRGFSCGGGWCSAAIGAVIGLAIATAAERRDRGRCSTELARAMWSRSEVRPPW